MTQQKEEEGNKEIIKLEVSSGERVVRNVRSVHGEEESIVSDLERGNSTFVRYYQ